jgi:ABC-type transport system involved in multi-copper enzyme maturation permease subunit
MRALHGRRIRAIVRKELRAYRRNGSIVAAMAVIPLVFLVQPLVAVLTVSAASAVQIQDHHELLYMLAIPALVPVILASYAVVGERQEGTLEPVLSTPIPREELLLGKALAVLMPAVALAYVVFGLFIALVCLFAHPGIPSALIRGPDVLVQVIFTPLIATWSIWIGIAISTRVSDIRVAQQLSVLASLPTVALTTLIALNVIHPTPRLAVGLGVALLIANRVGWRLVSAMFDRERLITSVK